jgi:hypothetical protein
MEEGSYECVYGLGECPVLAILNSRVKLFEQKMKVLPAEPEAATLSQMIQPFMQIFTNVNAQLPAFCANCPKRIVEIQRQLRKLEK